jgi:ABC-type Mn2+/Zn2+ transport system ATPase subunit
MNKDIILDVKGLSLSYGQKSVLKDVDLQVRAGEFWFFLGPNGTGKTTLIKAFLGVLKPQQGEIRFHPEYADRRSVGFVPQRLDLNPTLPTTVREFVTLGLAGIPVSGQEREARLARALEKMGMTGLRMKSYWSLSGGQRQRALVARALIRRPKLLIADEPTKDLDFTAVQGLMQSLTDLNREDGLTIFFITHDLDIAFHFCTHTALFLEGSVQLRSCQKPLKRADLEKVFGVPMAIGTPSP